MNSEVKHIPPRERLRELARDKRLEILRRALGEDAELHLVGGSVRDTLEGIISEKDLDCASRLLPEEILKRLEAQSVRVIATGLKHQTVTAVPVENEPGVEITTFRGPKMRPTGGVVSSENISIDLQYRDFTVNAMAFRLSDGQLLDPLNGQKDLEAKCIRAVGSPRERFQEDPLRVLRMVRMSCRQGYSLDHETKEASREFLEPLRRVSIERIRDEFSKILTSDSPQIGLRLLEELGFLPLIAPEIQAFVGFEQNEFHAYDLFEHTLEVIRKTPPQLLLRLAALLHDIAKPHTLSIDEKTGARHFFKHEIVGVDVARNIMTRLRYSHELIRDVGILIETHMRPLEAGPGGLRRLLRDTDTLYPQWRILKEADAASCKLEPKDLEKRLHAFDESIQKVLAEPNVSPLKNLAINGNDILALGYQAGPLIGKILREIHERVLDKPELNQKDTLLALVPEVAEKVH